MMKKISAALISLALVLSVSIAFAASTATLDWTNPVTNLDIVIEKASDPAGPFSAVITVQPATVNYLDAGPFAEGETVCYQLHYVNAAGSGPGSNVACKTFPILAPVVSPNSLTVR